MSGGDPLVSSKESGHDFHKKLLRPGHSCHHCGETLWGSSACCRSCKYIAHERCSEGLVTPCSSVAINFVVDPVAHVWSPAQKFKKKFCNVCRRKMDDRLGVRCMICKYYSHKRCVPISMPVCKRAAAYTVVVTADEGSQQRHQWLEGNLSSSAKCLVCSQPCASTDCLTGLRCLWCQESVHGACMDRAPHRCMQAAALRNLMLPAYAVFRPRMPEADSVTVNMATSETEIGAGIEVCQNMLLGFRLNNVDSDTVSLAESLASNVDIISRAPTMVTLRIYDTKKDRYKKVVVASDTSADELLAATQRSFNVHPNDRGQFCLLVHNPSGKYEPVAKLAGELEEAKARLVFRSTDQHMSHVRVHMAIGNSQRVESRQVSVSPLTTCKEVVALAIDEFGLIVPDAERSEYALVELNMYDGLQERILEPNDKPWQIMDEIARLSIEQLQMVRLYLRHMKMDLPVTLYVGNLPVGWEEERLVESLTQAIASSTPSSHEDITFGPTFPQLGCLFLFISDQALARHLFGVLKSSILVDTKHPTVILVPTIREDVLPENCNPLLTFVNERSGGGQGRGLLTQLVRLLNPYQVFNLCDGGPLPGLFAFRKLKSFRILVAGGDGTVGWVLSQMDSMKHVFACPNPSVAIVPLGTGNDLARVLRWGTGFSGESAMSILDGMDENLVVPLDRWNVCFESREIGKKCSPASVLSDSASVRVNDRQSAIRTFSSGSNGSNGSGTTSSNSSSNSNVAAARVDVVAASTPLCVMNNYLGIGVEAEIALKFHLAREENPERFNSRLHNKGVYLKMSIGKMMQRVGNDTTCDLSKIMSILVDEERIPIPSGIEGVICLNIKSWMAGADGWGSERDDKFKPPSMNDGLLEIIGVQGVMHLGQIQGGLRGGIRLAQGSNIVIRFSCALPVEIDGEPFMQSPGLCRITQGSTVQMMRRHRRLCGTAPPGTE